MHVTLRALAFASAGALVATLFVCACVVGAIYGIPVPLQLMTLLGAASISAWFAGRSHGPSNRRLAWTEAGLASLTAAAPWLLHAGPLAMVACVVAIASLAGAAVAALAQATDSWRALVRMARWASAGAALSLTLTALIGIPSLGMRATLLCAAGVHLLVAVVAWRGSTWATASETAAHPKSVATFVVSTAVMIVTIAWSRAFAATLVPTPVVLATCAFVPFVALAAGTAIGLGFARKWWGAPACGPLLLGAAIAFAIPVTPRTLPGAVSMAFGGMNWTSYFLGVLWDASLALFPAFLLLGTALPLLPRPRAWLVFAGGAAGCGVAVMLVMQFGAVPGATTLAAGLLALLGAGIAPRRIAFVTAGLAGCALASAFSFTKGPLPQRAGALQGALSVTSWDRDAFRSSVVQSDGSLLRSVDSVAVSGTGRDWHSARGGAHLAALLCPGAQHALVLGPGVEEAKRALRSHPGLSVKEASHARPALLAASRRRERFDVIVHRPPVEALLDAGGDYTVESYACAREVLSDRGVYAQEVSLRTTPLADLKRILASFSYAFPEGTAWFFREALLLVATRGPLHVELSALTEGLSAPSVYEDLARIGVSRPWDFIEGYLFDVPTLRGRIERVEPVMDDCPTDFLPADPRFAYSYIDDLAWLIEARQGLTSHVVAGKTRGERWLVSLRLDRMRKGGGFALMAQLKYAKVSRAVDPKEQGDLTNESVNAATQALKFDPGDRYAWETLSAAARFLRESPTDLAKEPASAPVDPPAPELWQFQPDANEQEVMSLLEDLDGERGPKRFQALIQLEEKHESSVAPLVGELASDPDPTFRACIAGVLQRLANPAAAPALVRLLTDPVWNVRRSAAEALAQVGRRDHVPALLDALGDTDASVREATYASIHAIVKAPIPHFDPRGPEAARAKQVEALRSWWDTARLAK